MRKYTNEEKTIWEIATKFSPFRKNYEKVYRMAALIKTILIFLYSIIDYSSSEEMSFGTKSIPEDFFSLRLGV